MSERCTINRLDGVLGMLGFDIRDEKEEARVARLQLDGLSDDDLHEYALFRIDRCYFFIIIHDSQ